MMSWKSLSVFSALVVNLHGQTDWDCNHVSFFPTDVCLVYGNVPAKFVCDGTDTVTLEYFSGDTNCTGNATSLGTVDELDFQCDQTESCDYFDMLLYNDTDCENYIGQFPIIYDQCIADNGTIAGYKLDCSDTDIVYKAYAENNCSGIFGSLHLDLNDFLDDEDTFADCIELECSSDYTPSPTSSPVEDGTFGPFDCNVGVWQFWPFVDGICSYFESSSYMVVCADDGDSATLYEYEGTSCSGDALNETDVEFFYCGSSSSCTMTTMSGNIYNDSDDCSSEATSGVEFNLGQMDTCVEIFTGLVYMGITVDDDGVNVGNYFLDSTCTSNSEFGFTLAAGCNQVDQEVSVNASFSTSTVVSDSASSTTSSGDSDDDSDTDDDGDTNTAPNRFGTANMKQIFTFIGTSLTIVTFKSF